MSFHLKRIGSFAAAVFAAMFILAVTSAIGQSGTSSVNGTVIDGQGQVVAGATVKLVSTGQGTSRTATTDGSGAFSFTSITPGTYSLEIEASGFKRSFVRNVQALVDKTTSIPVSLEIGDVTANVEVSAGGIENIVNTQDASLGNNFVSRQISQLPLEGRNVVDLLSLQPGVTPDGAVAGGRQDQANITLDGVDVNDQQTGLNIDQTEAFTSVLRVTPDSIEEFRVTTLNADATKGRSAGAQVSLITKSGTNQFRGNLFEYHRNTLTTANDWYNNAAGRYATDDIPVLSGAANAGDPRAPRPKLIRNLFGGSLGGPIIKDKLFFFYNYEGMREAKDQPFTQIVPLASLGAGNIRFFDTSNTLRTLDIATINSLTEGGIPVVDVNPVALDILAGAAARYPANIGGGDGINTGGFRFNASVPVELNTHTARFDYSPFGSGKHLLSFRGNYQQDKIGLASFLPDTPADERWSHPLGMAASHTWLINNNLTNRFSYGLTRLAYSNRGDSSENAITFRNIYTPQNFTYAFSRVNPTHNFTNDLTWVKGNHTMLFGSNIRIIRNKRSSLAFAFDNGTTNFGFYTNSGDDLLIPIDEYLQANFGTLVSDAWINSAQSSLVAVLGRVNQYTANFSFDVDGTPQSGVPAVREWATEEYDFYAQDSWKIKPSLTLNFGLRYGLSRPVYETQGFQAAPNIGLDEYFRRRQEAAFNGQNYDEPLIIDLAGPKNGKPGFYDWDKNNWQPRVSAAWSPNFKDGILAKIFGTERASVFRGGFAITNDYFGQQLAVSFDANNTLGFVSNYTTPPNTYNILDCDDASICRPAPLLTGLGMQIRNLPGVVVPGPLVFPLQKPQDLSLQIEASIDRGVKSPTNYSWNFTYGRTLPGKMFLEASYIGRAARNLLASRDVMMPNNLRDPATGTTYYEAATQLEILRRAGADPATVPNNPYWDNLWGAGSLGTGLLAAFGCTTPGVSNTQAVYETTLNCVGNNDWTTTQLLLDLFTDRQLFYQSQYGALDSFGTIAKSNYHAGALSLRQRLSTLSWDLNYTYSKSLDDTSGLQTAGAFGGAFILNPLRQSDNYAPSDFDMRHIVNFNAVWQLPVGRGRSLLGDANNWVDAIFGGWQVSSIVRYNSGEPMGTVNRYFDNAGWVTNWNTKSGVVQTRDIETGVFFNGDGGLPTMFANPQEAFNSFRSPFPGETGDRNRLRFPSYFVIDMGMQKQFKMPWSESHRLGFKWEVFNVTNTPVFTGPVSERRLGYKPETRTVPTGFGEFTATKSAARVMQFALRYDF
ncbi:MAG: carboxypeptidase regulatory-like domain-containing protein [Pyrinomonadaceae bacterium]